MGEAKSKLRLTNLGPAGSGDAAPPGPSEPNVPAGELTRVVAEMQSRLSSLEKRKPAAPRKKRGSTSDGAVDAASPASIEAGPPPASNDRRLADLRELEESLRIEELALHTRVRAAEREEQLMHHESQTLHLKLRSFRSLTLRLREQESQLAARAEELREAHDRLLRDQQKLEQFRHELEQTRQSLEQHQVTMIAQRTVSASQSSPATGVRPALPAARYALHISAIVIAVAALAGLCITLAWLRIDPIYRASATISPAATSIESRVIADHFDDSMLTASLAILQQRGLRPFDSTAAMAQALSDNLILSIDADRQLQLAYDSPQRDEAIFVLEALSRSYAKAHAGANVTITRAAAADLSPLRDDRFKAAVQYFITALLLIAAGIVGYPAFRRRFSKPA